VVATSATGTARALREREQPSSKSKHDEGRRGRRAT
jgi:hypothetical protein